MSLFENSKNFVSLANKRKDIPDGLWNRCEVCGEITFSKELERNLKICPKCGYHYPMSAREWIKVLIEPGNFTEYSREFITSDLSASQMRQAGTIFDSCAKGDWVNFDFDVSPPKFIITGEANIREYQFALCVVTLNDTINSNIQFNLNKIDYERILYTFNRSIRKRLPLITLYADGTTISPKSKVTNKLIRRNADAQNYSDEEEGAKKTDRSASFEELSFIQLINLAAKAERLSQERLLNVTVLINPHISNRFSTSFPLGDIVLAEPKLLNLKNEIVPRNSKQQLSQPHPADYLIDRYVNRRELKKTLVNILSFCR